jgi:hypothetical protein
MFNITRDEIIRKRLDINILELNNLRREIDDLIDNLAENQTNDLAFESIAEGCGVFNEANINNLEFYKLYEFKMAELLKEAFIDGSYNKISEIIALQHFDYMFIGDYAEQKIEDFKNEQGL